MLRIGLARGFLALLLLPGVSFALGLGDVHLNSPLNAPLDAEIELVNATPEDLATLDATLASKDTFARYGLDWPPFMSSVTVTRDRSASGAQVLRIKSTETVTEPFLTLLIEASWARGRLVREYTVLLDPPVFAPNAVAAAQPSMPAAGGANASGQISRPAQTETQNAAPTSAGGGDSYEVQRGDSLSAIARRLSASTGSQTSQLMVAIYRGNAGAFEGDMNRLRAGSVLRIPGSDEIAAVSPTEASGEVRRLAGGYSASSGTSGGGRLRLVPPSDSASNPGASAANSGQVDELQNRVRELEGQLNESKRMLELRNTELADLQAKLAASQQPPVAAQPAPTQTPVEQPAQPATAAPETATPEAAAPTQEPAPTPAETPAAQTPAEQTPAATTSETEEPSLVDKLIANWYLVAGALLALILVVLFAKSRGKRKSAEFDDNLGRLADHGEDRLAQPLDSLSDTGRMRAPNMGSIPEDILVEESGTHRALQETQDIPLAPTVRTDETISSETAVNLDQGDPLAEADFHMAYGLYDQAADLVRIAIQREPDRRDLKLKLLEVFFVWGNRDQFIATARELSDTRGESTQGEWEKIVIMGKQIAPEDQMFSDGSGGGGGAVGVDLNLDAGGSGRVDFDPFDVSARMDVTGGGNSDAVDLDLGSALRDPDATGEGLALPTERSGQTTREMTVKMTPAGSEAPTVEQPALRPLDEPTIREKVEGAMRRKLSSDQTAELALDDLGLELGSLEQTDSQIGLKPVGGMPRGPDANAPTMVAGLDENSQRLLAAAAARHGGGDADDSQITEHGASGTWFLTERELGGDVDLTKGRSIDPNSTASMSKLQMPEEGFDISSTSRLAAIDRNNLDFPVEPTSRQPAMRSKVDLDLGGNGYDLPGSPTEELAVPDLEPVTLSEVGTKLDLARAYVDMGDPDGARNILNEVLSEGSASQKQEAQRLLESLPG
ncbi:MAG TPA: FimV/HubP family polar landmark protein [Steroidobacteraceae bacterium]|jgi:pilus assembly protein FimV|nr:FimV/HubP family polar landmark protein [Steroidobacteraceae bacterium]